MKAGFNDFWAQWLGFADTDDEIAQGSDSYVTSEDVTNFCKEMAVKVVEFHTLSAASMMLEEPLTRHGRPRTPPIGIH